MKAAAKTPQTFNSFYANKTESAFFTSGLLPLRPTGVNPDLPTDGTGKYEWKGYLASAKHPQVINPSSGYIVNWNNKPAKNFPAGDERFGTRARSQRVGPAQQRARRAARRQTLANVLGRGQRRAPPRTCGSSQFWPTLKAMLDKGKAPSARATQLVAALQAWHDAGGSARDANGDGKIDDPGALILDAAWSGITDAACATASGTRCASSSRAAISRFDQPPGRPVQRLAPVHGQGLPHDAGAKVSGQATTCATAATAREALLEGAVGRDRRRRQDARRPAGLRPGRVAQPGAGAI